jgi:hypothetical protein
MSQLRSLTLLTLLSAVAINLIATPEVFAQSPATTVGEHKGSSSSGDVVPGDQKDGKPVTADLRNVQTGETVTIRLTDGVRIEGTLFEATNEQLTVTTKRGRQLIRAANISEITHRQKDPIWNGLIIGAAAGALMGAVLNGLNDCDPNECGEAYVVAGGLALGAAVGAGIDALWRKNQVLYRAPQSKTHVRVQILAGNVTGARISWRF